MKALEEPIKIALYYLEGTKDIILEEILKTEGIPYVKIDNLSKITGFKALILGEMPLTSSQIGVLENFLEEGGVLVAVKPDSKLNNVFGVTDTHLTQEDGYLFVKNNNPYERVSYTGKLQIFGSSKLYVGGEGIVGLSPSETHSGIIRNCYGKGVAFLVAYDISTTFLFIQQSDSAVGKAIDTARVEEELANVPQLDLMRRLFINLILESLRIPIPRKWYYSGKYRALLLVGGDQDGSGYDVLSVVKELVKKCRAPYTLFTTPMTQPLSEKELQDLVKSGLEVAFHSDFFVGGRKIMEEGCSILLGGKNPFAHEEFATQLSKAERDAGVKIIGHRSHGLRWGTVLDIPAWMDKLGLQYDSTLGVKLSMTRPPKVGYFQGGGLPFFFIHPQTFRRMNVLEQPVMATDDTLFCKHQQYTVSIIPNVIRTFITGMELTEDQAFQLAKEFIDDSVSKYYTVQCYCWHPIYLASKKLGISSYHSDSFFRKTVEYARVKGVLLMGHNEWNNYWRTREEILYEDLHWNSITKTLRFRIQSKQIVKNTTHMVPLQHEGKRARVFINKEEVFYDLITMNEREYAMFTTDLNGKAIEVTVTYGS